jgi:RsiW-degrading membrane proteinase PrsW (M82 family)
MPSATEESKQSNACCESQLQDLIAYADRCAKKEPLKTSLIAFLIGLVLTILPIGQIVGALARLLLSLLRPALVVLGAMKIFEEIEKRREPKK